MKKAFTYICGLICITAIFAASGQKADGSADLLWSGGCLLVAAITGWAFGKLSKVQTKNNTTR